MFNKKYSFLMKMFCYLIFGFLVDIVFCALTRDLQATYYEGQILRSSADAALYRFDTDASRYKSMNGAEIIDFGEFDFVIVGGGTSGCVVASRLSEIEGVSVLLLEAGEKPNEVTDIPAMGWHALKSDYNWGFYSKPQTTCCQGYEESRCPYPRGRGLGGSSLVNANMIVRGSREDYTKWASLGLPNWSYDDVLHYYKKSEDFHDNKPYAPVNWAYHSQGNPFSIMYNNINNSRTRAFLDAHLELNIPVADYNADYEFAASPIQVNLRDGGKRCDTGTVYILKNLDRPNLKVMTNSFVTKLDVSKESKTVNGVYFSFQKQQYYVRVSKEAILSAGALQSPQLLMLSGIGPKEHLQEMNIDVIEDLQVGTLEDHSNIPMFFNHNATDDVLKTLRQDALEYTDGKGRLSTFNMVSCLTLLRTENVDLEITLMPALDIEIPSFQNDVMKFSLTTLTGLLMPAILKPLFLTYMVNLHPKSQGTLRLRSKDPYQYPVIDSQLFSDPQDLDDMYKILQMLKRLLNTNAFKRIEARIAMPLLRKCLSHKIDSKDYWYCVFREIGFPSFHPSGTCRIGNNVTNGAVVNETLNVHGIQNLRVVDASIIPFPMRNHPMATCIMLAERLSDIIKTNYGLA